MNADELIYVIEPNRDDLFLLGRALAAQGVDNPIQCGRTAEEAKRYLGAFGTYQNGEAYPVPALIILDLDLRPESGLEILRWIRSRKHLREAHVVALGSAQRDGDAQRAYELGVDAFLDKALDFSAVARVVQELAWSCLASNHGALHAVR
jgi:CheY-like chemotaxis protein